MIALANEASTIHDEFNRLPVRPSDKNVIQASRIFLFEPAGLMEMSM